MDVTVAAVTETWLADGAHLEEDKQDLLLGAGLGIIYRNRKKIQQLGWPMEEWRSCTERVK